MVFFFLNRDFPFFLFSFAPFDSKIKGENKKRGEVVCSKKGEISYLSLHLLCVPFQRWGRKSLGDKLDLVDTLFPFFSGGRCQIAGGKMAGRKYCPSVCPSAVTFGAYVFQPHSFPLFSSVASSASSSSQIRKR